LIREQIKLRELSTDAEDPSNKARWKEISIESADRKKILSKIAGLQRRLIQKTEASVQFTLDIRERQKQIVE
jgi:hypothetical protein